MARYMWMILKSQCQNRGLLCWRLYARF